MKYSYHTPRWILRQPNQSPVFVGEIARWHTPCVTSPNPTLHYLSEDTAHINANQSIIPWPPADTDRPLDSHLSDCESSTFCDLDAGICIDRLDEDATCDSTNQCKNPLLCIQNKCTDVSLDGNEDDPPSNGTNKVHIAIIVVVVVVAVLAIVSIAGIVYYRRKVRMLKSKGDPSDSFQIPLQCSLYHHNNSNMYPPLLLFEIHLQHPLHHPLQQHLLLQHLHL